MHHGGGKADPPLLTATEVLDRSARLGQVEQFTELVNALVDEGLFQLKNLAGVDQHLIDGEIGVQRDFLWHIADVRSRNAQRTVARYGVE